MQALEQQGQTLQGFDNQQQGQQAGGAVPATEQQLTKVRHTQDMHDLELDAHDIQQGSLALFESYQTF